MMPPYHPLPYTSLCADLVHPPSPIRPSPQPPPSLPRYRLNLLASDGVHLYHPLNRNQLAKYLISRPHAPVPTPLPPIPITPPTTINNIRISHFPHPKSPTIVMTGGHELSLSPGTLTLHTPGSPTANTQNLPLQSAWGLATHPSGSIALTTNSASGLVLSLDTPDRRSLPHISNLHAHVNNIPCVHFSPCGNFLASASIDFTYAIYHTATGTRLHQSGQPATDRHPTRNVEWCWAVHWLQPDIAVSIFENDPVWVAFSEQRRFASWEPPEGYAFVPAPRATLFHPPDPVSARSCVLYHDYSPVEGPSERLQQPVQSSLNHEPRIIAGSTCCSSIEKNPIHPSSGKPESIKQNERNYLMVVCKEQTIFLCRVHASLNDAEDGIPSVSVDTLDALKIKLSKGTRRQIMYTNVIDVPKLNLIIVTGVNTGVILLRILQPTPGPMFELFHEGDMQISTNPILFVERVITPQSDSIIGTCVVERPGESLATESFELWILTQDGMIECWDLSRGELALDLSARF